jgi:hypothetical protein
LPPLRTMSAFVRPCPCSMARERKAMASLMKNSETRMPALFQG